LKDATFNFRIRKADLEDQQNLRDGTNTSLYVSMRLVTEGVKVRADTRKEI